MIFFINKILNYFLYTNYLFWTQNVKLGWIESKSQQLTSWDTRMRLMIIIPFFVTKSLARAMTHTCTVGRKRERVPTYLGTFHTSYIICRNVKIFKRYNFFSKRQKNCEGKKNREYFGMLYYFCDEFFLVN